MDCQQAIWADGWMQPLVPDARAQWVLLFGAAGALEDRALMEEVRQAYPHARITGCTTAGEICGTAVGDDSLVVTSVRFAAATVEVAAIAVGDDSRETGRLLVERLPAAGLRHVFVLSDGLHINGTQLAEGLREGMPRGAAATGGLAGDGPRFERTLTILDGDVQADRVLAVGLYGEGLRVGYGSLGGWDPFGPTRLVTRSDGNILYELDGQPALALYKRYLGEHVDGLPATGLLFPLSLMEDGREVVRTILAVDEDAQSVVFAGDVPTGARARLMRANFDRLVDGASGAASHSRDALGAAAELGILISCVGRKLVLKQRTEQELEAVQEVLGDATLAGFYSYGEICPSAPGAGCELHNQTMTITTLRES